MDMHQALQGVLEKVKETNVKVLTVGTQGDQLKAILDNQERIAESLLILGTVIQTALGDDIQIEVMAPKGTHLN